MCSEILKLELGGSWPWYLDKFSNLFSFFSQQPGLERQSSMGWGGRPLQSSPFKQQQQPQNPRSRARGGGDGDFSTGPPSTQQHHPHYHPQNQQRMYPASRTNSSGLSRHNSIGNNRRNNNNGNGNNQQQPQRHHNNNGNGNNSKHNAAANNNAANNNQGNYRRLWQQVTSIHRGGRLGDGDGGPGGPGAVEATVEDLLEIVTHLPADASAIQTVAHGLYSLDSGALAALLKELNKAGHARRAQEIFDWLRSLDPTHDLSALCTTMTYTTMISQCGTQQALPRALELMAEMRGRGVQCNVHTYSALMNVCIKANELDLALDVYRQMMAEGCTPNLVTYNTLIDVYGKTGAWEEAVAVLDVLESQGIEPEVRTYNTVIIACNQSSRAAEALKVYERMLAAGAQPTATTYTALISAYGKAGQLDSALQIFQDMLRRGCERNVITYSSLISACEKAGRWELALQLFQEMHAEGCRPNVVTYNSLIAACAQGAQWKKAQELFEQMQGKGCRPDAVTFGGLIAAYDRAGLWRRALASFEQMRGMNCRPDTVVYNTVIGALWRTGLLWAQARAVQIFHAACRQGHFRLTVHTVMPGSSSPSSGGTTPSQAQAQAHQAQQQQQVLKAPLSPQLSNGSSLFGMASLDLDAALTTSFILDRSMSGSLTPDEMVALAATCRSPSPAVAAAAAGCGPLSSPPLSPSTSLGAASGGNGNGNVTIEFGMHAFTIGSAVLSLLRWISELRDRLPTNPSRVSSGQSVALLLNKGKPSREHTYPAIKAALLSCLSAWRSPFVLRDVPQGCRIDASALETSEWLATPAAEAALSWFMSGAADGPNAHSPNGAPNPNPHRDLYFHEDSMIEARCAEAFSAVSRFESAYAATVEKTGEQQHQGSSASSPRGNNNTNEDLDSPLSSPSPPSSPTDDADALHALTTQRRRWFRATADLAAALGHSDEVVHDATLLLDRAVAAANPNPLGCSPAAAVVASLFISARQAGEIPATGTSGNDTDGGIPADVVAATGLQPGETEAAMTVLRSLLGGDTSSISALRVLKLFLERLGADFSQGTMEGLRPAAGIAFELLPLAICDAELCKLAPSTVAAAVLMAGRRLDGKSPFWPAVLGALTGLDDGEGSALSVAVERTMHLQPSV